MKIAHILLALTITTSLAGCMSPEERAQRLAYERQMRDQNEIYECQSLGFEQGTQEFGDCRLRLRTIEAQERMSEAQAATAQAIADQNQTTTVYIDNSESHDHHHDNGGGNPPPPPPRPQPAAPVAPLGAGLAPALR